MKILIVLIVGLAGATQAQQQKLLPEELSMARAIATQERGEIQVTASAQYFKMPEEKMLTWGADIEYGITERLELDLEVPYAVMNPNEGQSVSGLGDMELALRYAFVPVSERPFAFNAGVNVTTPTGSRSKELGEGQVALGPFFTASQWLGPVNLQLDAGWEHVVSNGGDEPRDDFEYNVAVIYPIRNFFLVLEGNGVSNREHTEYYLTPELIWHSQQGFEVNLAMPLGLTPASGDFGAVISISFEFDGPFSRDDDPG